MIPPGIPAAAAGVNPVHVVIGFILIIFLLGVLTADYRSQGEPPTDPRPEDWWGA